MCLSPDPATLMRLNGELDRIRDAWHPGRQRRLVEHGENLDELHGIGGAVPPAVAWHDTPCRSATKHSPSVTKRHRR
jgi:hypothetical protein